VEANSPQVAIVGAGPSGVACGLALQDVGVRALVIDRADQVGSAWRTRYDRLRLNSSRLLSGFPRRRFPRGTPMFPTRDQMVAYIEHCATMTGLDLRLATEVHSLARDGASWVLATSSGEIRAPQVIVATGHENEPFITDWPGRESFEGRLLHSSDYRNAEGFGDSRVLVVGPGSSGMEIAYDLVEGGADTVWLSARTPPNIVLREGRGGLPGDFIAVTLLHTPTRFGDAMARFGRRTDVGDLSEFGLPVPEDGIFSRLHRHEVAPAIVDQDVIEAIRTRRIEIVRGVEALDSTGATLADGMRVEPDAVICATGYREGLERLVGDLDVLDADGRPRERGERPAAPGLRFVGYTARPGALSYTGKEARRAARAIARELRA